jgi:DNA-binding transcriptional LysR family regulator
MFPWRESIFSCAVAKPHLKQSPFKLFVAYPSTASFNLAVDKLRAIQYFIASAEARSFSGAARELDVSVPAIARLIGSLEKSLSTQLFERTVQGITLTADGSAYLDVCQPLVRQLAAADDALRGAASRPLGTLVIGAPAIISQHCIVPMLPVFHQRYPDIEIDIRTVDKPSAADAELSELQVLYGWPEHPGLIHRRLVNTRMFICASPAYWAAHGMPTRIGDLANHPCLLFRDQEGTVIDYWAHEFGGVKEAVTVNGWLVSNHRDVILDAAIAGLGVARFTDVSVLHAIKAGQLVPALIEWESRHAPPINLLYRASQRRLPRVRLMIDFLLEMFQKMDADRLPGMRVTLPPERPPWYRRRHGRASSTPRDKG